MTMTCCDEEKTPAGADTDNSIIVDTPSSEEAQQQATIEDAWKALTSIKDEVDNFISLVGESVSTMLDDAQTTYIDILNDTAATALQAIEQSVTRLKKYRGFIEEEIKKPEYDGLTLEDLEHPENLTPVQEELADKLYIAVLARLKDEYAEEETENIPSTSGRISNYLDYPLDKLNSLVAWSRPETDTGKRINVPLEKKAGRGHKKDHIDSEWTVNFDLEALESAGLHITLRLDTFDKLVYIAMYNLYMDGNKIQSLRMICRQMGNTEEPSKAMMDRVADSIKKMTCARINYSNEQEAKAYKYKTFSFKNTALLEADLGGTADINGGRTYNTVTIIERDPDSPAYREPFILMDIAESKKQLTTVPIEALSCPGMRNNDENTAIMDYMRYRIFQGNESTVKMDYKTIADRAGITSKKQIARIEGKAKRYADHLANQGLIKGYTLYQAKAGGNGIEVHVK